MSKKMKEIIINTVTWEMVVAEFFLIVMSAIFLTRNVGDILAFVLEVAVIVILSPIGGFVLYVMLELFIKDDEIEFAEWHIHIK